jgi:DNA/RNA endonuclease YhcR with UshA esterase domain
MKTLAVLLVALVGMWGIGCILPQEQQMDDDDSQADDDDSQADDDDSQSDDDDTGGPDDDDSQTDDDDDSQTDDDDDSQTDDDDTVGNDTDIRDIQQGLVAEGTIVEVNNVVVSAPIGEVTTSFYVQEPGIPADAAFSGINVYVANPDVVDDLTPLIVIGNTVNITGLYEEYYGLSELKIDDASNVAVTGTFVLNPAVVDPCDVATGGALQPDFEAVFVRVGNVSVTDVNPDDPQEFGEFEVANCLRVDDVYVPEEPAQGAAYLSISGVMNWSFDNAKLEPRTPADLAPY